MVHWRVISQGVTSSRVGYEHDKLKGFLVHRELDGDVWKVVVDFWIWFGFDGRIVHRIFVVLIYGTNTAVGLLTTICRKGGRLHTSKKDYQPVEGRRTELHVAS
jgi:hypothetical protein